MDRFEGNEGVVALAATNRPEILDPALLRPQRSDRVVSIPPIGAGGWRSCRCTPGTCRSRPTWTSPVGRRAAGHRGGGPPQPGQ
jgi:hypothetical protein